MTLGTPDPNRKGGRLTHPDPFSNSHNSEGEGGGQGSETGEVEEEEEDGTGGGGGRRPKTTTCAHPLYILHYIQSPS
jgi:hypothetical protein